MWEHRRYVLTGPLLNHWAAQFGIAPLDVIVGRFVRAICCLSGLPPIALPEGNGGLGGFGGIVSKTDGPFAVGNNLELTEFAKARNTEINWVQPADLSVHFTRSFLARMDRGATDVLAVKVPDGASFAIAVPRAEKPEGKSKLHGELVTLFRRGEMRTAEDGRLALADFTHELLRSQPVNVLVRDTGAAELVKVADAATVNGMNVVDVIDGGSGLLLTRARLADTPENRAAAATLVNLAETAADEIAIDSWKLNRAQTHRRLFGDAGTQDKLADVVRKILPKVDPKTVAGVANRIAKR